MTNKKLQLLIEDAKNKNKGLKLYINKRYKCMTCGSKTGESHPVTSYCFRCDTDNWEIQNHAPVWED